MILLVFTSVICLSAGLLPTHVSAEDSHVLGMLLKTDSRLNKDNLIATGLHVKAINGNVISVNMSTDHLSGLNMMNGICAYQVDLPGIATLSRFDAQGCRARFAGAEAVIGILDNSGVLSPDALTELKKVEAGANVGFVSYRSSKVGSTVIIRNLEGGESNLVAALSYMQDYANTVERPLVVQLLLQGDEMNNPLFVQVCQIMADNGVQFLAADSDLSTMNSSAPMQLSFAVFNTKTGQVADRSSYWTMKELQGRSIALNGSDCKECSVSFSNESGFRKALISNGSTDNVIVTAIAANGLVYYYRLDASNTAIIPRTAFNGMPILEDGLDGIYPFYAKQVLLNAASEKGTLVTLNDNITEKHLATPNAMGLSIGSSSGTLNMNIDDLRNELNIVIRDRNGETVYKNHLDQDTKSIRTKIDLSRSTESLYFLDLASDMFNWTYALVID